MNNLERETINKYERFVHKHQTTPTFADCVIRFKSDGSIIDATIAMGEPASTAQEEEIFFYTKGIFQIIALLANIDDLEDRLGQEVDAYQVGVEDFVITEVVEFY